MTPEAEQELERTTRLRGFRYGLHDFLAETDLEALKRTNDKVERDYITPTGLDRKLKEVAIIAACVGMADEVPHIVVHMHAAVKHGGLTQEEVYSVINLISPWVGITGTMKAFDAYRQTFYPEMPTIERVTALA